MVLYFITASVLLCSQLALTVTVLYNQGEYGHGLVFQWPREICCQTIRPTWFSPEFSNSNPGKCASTSSNPARTLTIGGRGQNLKLTHNQALNQTSKHV